MSSIDDKITEKYIRFAASAFPVAIAGCIALYAKFFDFPNKDAAISCAVTLLFAAAFNLQERYVERLPYWIRGPLYNWSASAYFAILLMAVWFGISAFFLPLSR
jgi:hypothetical protein